MALRRVSTPGLLVAAIAGTAVAAAGVPAGGGRGAAAPALRLPAERVLKDSTDSPGPVVFRHSTHFALAGNTCLGCHPALFKMLKRVFRGQHAQMDAGQTCGRCHDGKRAFGTADAESCGSCHGAAVRDPMGAVLALPRSADSPGAVAFDHRSHVRAAARCSACHPKPFGMSATRKPRAAGVLHEKSACGQCHDGKTAFSVEERCDGCHREEAGR
jgi:c(7)-type cytochrome triheme protein